MRGAATLCDDLIGEGTATSGLVAFCFGLDLGCQFNSCQRAAWETISRRADAVAAIAAAVSGGDVIAQFVQSTNIFISMSMCICRSIIVEPL